ncbi:MAG: amino acid adenylation domain-containing protein [Granulosicoccus sp.]
MTGFLIHSPLEHFARNTPQHPALVCEGVEMSYAELDQRSNRLAHALIDNGAQRGDRVGIHMHKCLELGVAIYGILKAGCVFVPLDPFMPEARISFIIDDCDIRHLLTNDALAPAILSIQKQQPLHIYGTKHDSSANVYSWDAIAQYQDLSPNLPMIDQELGYIMYTSGSTGVPKGMMHTHLGSVTYARWGADHVSMSASDRVASHAPLHFDLSIFDFFSTVQSGATVVLVPEPVTRFAASWTQTIESERISVVFTVPYTLITMVEQGAMDSRDLSSLRWVLFGGEPFPPDKLRRLMLQLENVSFTNVYGPAEAPSCTCHDVLLPEEGSEEPISIGIVSRNSSDIIIDENDEDCPDGQPGELCIRSTTLTRGYWNRPDLNKVAFLTRQTVEAFPAVYFRTGDRVVRQPDGNLAFLGRIGRMVKVRGQRVELDEVESVLATMPDAQEVAAITVPGPHDSLQIVCAITLTTGSSAVAADFLKLARSRLPPFAVPGEIQILQELPHTSTGKLNRKQLAEAWTHQTQ